MNQYAVVYHGDNDEPMVAGLIYNDLGAASRAATYLATEWPHVTIRPIGEVIHEVHRRS